MESAALNITIMGLYSLIRSDFLVWFLSVYGFLNERGFVRSQASYIEEACCSLVPFDHNAGPDED